jgi:GT2 family glycosyltransferase
LVGRAACASIRPVFQPSVLISIVISNLNGARFLPRLFDSIAAQRDVRTEIIVVDRESTDGSQAWLALQPGIRVISEPARTGMGAGYHAGAQLARGELIFFSSEDLWLEETCLARLQALIDPAARMGAADPWQWDYDGRVFKHGGVRFVPSRLAFHSPYLRRRTDFEVPLKTGEANAFGCGGALLMLREMYVDTGGWDPGFFLDNEDLDLSIRAWQRGWKIRTCPEARVFHAVSSSNKHPLSGTGETVAKRRYVSQRASLSIIALKYFSWWQLPMAALVWPMAALNNLRHGRLGALKYDVRVLREILQRAPAALAFRRANAPYNLRRPGEVFFTTAEHQRPAAP